MRVLFVHQNFPAQYVNALAHLLAAPGNEVVYLTQRQNWAAPGARQVLYSPTRQPGASTHAYVASLEGAVLNGQAVWRAALELKRQGFRPDIMIGHNAWGETLFLKDVFPDAPLLGYFEFFYRARDSDADFDGEFPCTADDRLRIRIKNAVNLLGLEAADWGQTATQWQRGTYPERHRDRISAIHEGVDTALVKPDPDARITLQPSGAALGTADEVITYVARNLEPYRGFHVFMRALPEILRRRPKAHVLLVGGNDVSYGKRLPEGETYLKRYMAEVERRLDAGRVHFLGHVPFETHVKLLQVSSVHVYLTYPFVLSWSMLEAMSAGCAVVASRTAPVEEIIRHGENGLLVDFFSAAALVDAIEAVLEHPDRMQAMRQQARRTIVERYDMVGVCVPRYMALIDDLIAGRQPAGPVT